MGNNIGGLDSGMRSRSGKKHGNQKRFWKFKILKRFGVFLPEKAKASSEADTKPESESETAPQVEDLFEDCHEEWVSGSEIPCFECEICAEERRLDDSFNIKGCAHFFCKKCVVNYVTSKLEDNITLIQCPLSGCDGVLDPEYCRFILPREAFDRWGFILCESAISEPHKFYCPYRDCSALLINDGAEEEEQRRLVDSTCHHCRRAICVRCKEPWHSQMSCKKFQRLKKKGGEAFVEELAKKKKWRRCPNCHIFVERTHGCYYIKCRCGFAFCYNCGAASHIHRRFCSLCRH